MRRKQCLTTLPIFQDLTLIVLKTNSKPVSCYTESLLMDSCRRNNFYTDVVVSCTHVYYVKSDLSYCFGEPLTVDLYWKDQNNNCNIERIQKGQETILVGHHSQNDYIMAQKGLTKKSVRRLKIQYSYWTFFHYLVQLKMDTTCGKELLLLASAPPQHLQGKSLYPEWVNYRIKHVIFTHNKTSISRVPNIVSKEPRILSMHLPSKNTKTVWRINTERRIWRKRLLPVAIFAGPQPEKRFYEGRIIFQWECHFEKLLQDEAI